MIPNCGIGGGGSFVRPEDQRPRDFERRRFAAVRLLAGEKARRDVAGTVWRGMAQQGQAEPTGSAFREESRPFSLASSASSRSMAHGKAPSMARDDTNNRNAAALAFWEPTQPARRSGNEAWAAWQASLDGLIAFLDASRARSAAREAQLLERRAAASRQVAEAERKRVECELAEAVADRRIHALNSSLAPFGPRRRNRPSLSIRLR